MKDEIKIQETIIQFLEDKNLIPFDVIYTNELGGALSITFYMREDLGELLNYLGYKSMCDKSGFTVSGNTVILSGMALLSFIYNEKKY